MTDKEITREQLLESLVTAAYTGDPRDGTWDQFRRWFGEDQIPLDENDVLLAMDELEIENINERIEWYNVVTLNLDDVLRLCNMKFYVLKANCCDRVQYLGDDYYQGINSKNELINASGSINGQSVDVYLCEKHWPKWLT